MKKVLLAAAAIVVALPCAAQVHSGPKDFKKITPAAAAESLKVLRHLEQVVTQYPDSAAAWYRRGMIAWALAARDNSPPPIRDLDWTLLGHMADTSLRKAAQIDPARVEYKLAAGGYLAASFGPVNRTAASIQYNQAVTAVRRISDPAAHALAALEAGRLYFRLYDSKEHLTLGAELAPQLVRPGNSGVPPPSIDEIANELNRLKNVRDFSGEQAYLKAESLFDEADRFAPRSAEVFQARAALYAARNRWKELENIAITRTRVAPRDAWAWMTLGLASHRLGQVKVAPGAFDSAMVRFDSAEAKRLDKWERVLRPADSARFAGLSASDRFARERLYWLMADPMWSVDGNEPRIEFLARVAFAELRWSTPETDELGADSERGQTFVRYGPPNSIYTAVNDQPPDAGMTFSYWIYTGIPEVEFKGYERLQWTEPDFVAEIIRDTPVRWDNIRPIRVDTMQVQIARFRATRDSVDVYFADAAPAMRMSATSDVTTPPLASFWLMRGGVLTAAHDSGRYDATQTATFINRVQLGNFVYRAEASVEGGKFGTRATGVLVTAEDPATGFAPRGFGMSDVILAQKLTATTATPRRWSDFTIVPVIDRAVEGAPVSLLWENYEFGADAGRATYDVTITIDRDRSAAGRIAVSILNGIAGAVGVTPSDDRMQITFHRSVPHAAAIVDNIDLALGETPSGRYKITVEVADKVSGHATAWSRWLTIGPQ